MVVGVKSLGVLRYESLLLINQKEKKKKTTMTLIVSAKANMDPHCLFRSNVDPLMGD